jgi:hypothetical protein
MATPLPFLYRVIHSSQLILNNADRLPLLRITRFIIVTLTGRAGDFNMPASSETSTWPVVCLLGDLVRFFFMDASLLPGNPVHRTPL